MKESFQRRTVATFRNIGGLLGKAVHIPSTADSVSIFVRSIYVGGIEQAMARIMLGLLHLCGPGTDVASP